MTSTASSDRSLLVRAAVWGASQAVFFFWVYPLGRWARRDTNVYFCFAAFALASLAIAAVLPVLSRVSPRARLLLVCMSAVGVLEFIVAIRVLLYQF
jgi:hypothetical protein